MKEEVFEEILRCIHLPFGELLSDNTTYRVTRNDFSEMNTKHSKELNSIYKFLVLTSDGNKVVGGILFYESGDIQAQILPEYKGMHYMSKIHKNGILKSECSTNQKVSLSTVSIDSFDDFQMKHYLLSCAGLKISNLSEIHGYYKMFKLSERFKGFQKISLDEFIQKYS